MKFLLNGDTSTGASVKLFKAAHGEDITVRILADTGAPIDFTGDTLTLEVYEHTDRRNTAVKSIAVDAEVEAEGYGSIAPTPTTNSFGPGSYYGFLKQVSSGVVTVSDNYYKIVVG